jgi:hypothetical protein
MRLQQRVAHATHHQVVIVLMRRAAKWIVLSVVVAACASARSRRAQQRCEEFVSTLRSDALPQLRPHLAAAPGLSFEAVQFGFAPIDPHGGPRPCWLAALMPAGWQETPAPPDGTPPGRTLSSDAGRSTFTIEWLPGALAADAWPAFIDETWLAPRRHAPVERDEASHRSHVLVTREDDALRLLMLRWHPPQPGYIRCEARLAGEYAAALSAFEAACSTALSLWWETPNL